MNTGSGARHRWRWVILIVALVALAALGYGYIERDTIRFLLAHWTGEEDLGEQLKGTLALAYLLLSKPAPQTAPYVPVAHTGIPPYGVNTFLEQEVEPHKVERSLRMIANAGFCWIRQEFPWEDIEIAAKGDYWDHKWNVSTWEKYDRIVALAEQYGLEIIVRLDNPPAWSREVGMAPGWDRAPPDNYDNFGDYVQAVVSRYRGRIRYYQIWNEPNIFPEWGDQPADPEGYVELLKVAYRRAKQADPDCVILCAALAANTEETPPEFGPRNMSDLLYLERMYEAGVQGHFDIMSAMIYGLWTGPYDLRTSRDRTNFSRVQLLREIMVQHGDAHKPIWVSEVGWSALPEGFPGAAVYGRVTEEQQAIYAVEAYIRAAREWPWMGVMNYWFLRRPSDAEASQAWYYFRLLEPDFGELPVYGALSWLANQTPVMPIGYHQENHWALQYSGSWQHLRDRGAVLGAVARGDEGAELSFYFRGTDLALALRDPDAFDRLEILVDGRTVRPSRLHRAPKSAPSAVTVAHHLKDAQHEVIVRVTEGKVDLDGLVVWRRPPLWIPCMVSSTVLLIALCAVLLMRRRTAAAHA